MDVTGVAAWIALSLAMSRRRLAGVMARFPDPDAAWAAGEEDLAQAALDGEAAGCPDPADPGDGAPRQRRTAARDRLARYLAVSRRELAAAARRIQERLERCGGRALPLCDPAYPPILRHIPDPPALLYLRGPLAPGEGIGVALVGARRPDGYGLGVAETLAADLARAGVTVVSGMARGIDCAAHRGALHAGGRTVAVLGSGVDVPYPASERSLYARIVESGLILSEYPPGTPARPGHFPERNRLVSGLSQMVVVVQATLASGSRHTVEAAQEQGREVGAVPGPVDSPLSAYPHQLLREGARLVTGAADILEGLHLPAVPRPLGPGTADEAAVLAELQFGPRSADELAIRTGVPPARLLAALTSLELAGAVRTLPDGRFATG